MSRKSNRSNKGKAIKYSPSESFPLPNSLDSIMTTPTSAKTSSAIFTEDSPSASLNKDLNDIMVGLPEDIRSIFLALIPAILEKFDKTAERIVNELRAENASLKAESANLNKRLNDQHKKIESIQNQCKFMQIEYETDINRLEQYGRRSNVELAGIPDDVTDGDLERKVIDILSEIDVKVAPHEIEACHRLFQGRNVKGPKRTIVRFVNRKTCDRIFRNKHKMKNLNKKKLNLTGNIYVNYSLCRDYRRLWYHARMLHNDGHIAKFWVSGGTVKIAMALDSSPISILHKSKLEELFPGRDFDSPAERQ